MEKTRSSVTIRRISTEEAEVNEAGRILKRAFNHVQEPQLGSMVSCYDLEKTCRAVRFWSSHPKIYGVVACDKESGHIIGSNFLDQRGEAAAVGPITVDPDTQSAGAGRALMEAVIERAKQPDQHHTSVRLLQESYNCTSYSLYAKLGFEPKDQVCFFKGCSEADWEAPKINLTIRLMEQADLPACAALYKRVVGVDRSQEISDCMLPAWTAAHDAPLVAIEESASGGRIVGYLCSATSFGHGVAESDEVIARLYHHMTQEIKSRRDAGTLTRRDDDIVLKVISRLSPKLVDWALGRGKLRLQRLMTLMAMGDYADPDKGTYSPSVMY